IDEDTLRLANAMRRLVNRRREHLAWRRRRLFAAPVHNRIRALYERRSNLYGRLKAAADTVVQQKRSALEGLYGRMYALSPAAVLDRGYSITRSLPDKIVLKNAADAEEGGEVEVILSKGSINCRIERKFENGKEEL
ncbi:MAG: hypothetical protein K9J79_11380, partial [Desulfobacteraceae bacterium]|nr:hypothetical protein [Desulfobacteraceae bacterium]